MSSCGPTLDVSDLPDTEVAVDETDGAAEEQSLEIWGRFFPLPRAGLTGIGIHLYTCTFDDFVIFILKDFSDDEYIFGRSEDCDYCFESRGGTSNQHYPTYSSTHFRIYRVRMKERTREIRGENERQGERNVGETRKRD